MKSEKQLYQWDVNQYLTELQPTAEYVDYPIGNEVIRIEADGTRCRIPDEFLQSAGFKTCYERYSDGTYKAYSFNVLSSPKPPDYVYTAEERTTFEALVEKADAAIAEIKRRADSGEFRKVVDGATTEYNDNHNLKLAKYNANASEKLTTYDTNAEQHTTDYNRNAEQKLEAYNQNHTEKVAEYNANAETKTAEFDSNAAALQTEVDRLRGECDTLVAENRKQENRIDALIKLNKGQTYDILPEDGEAASRTAPSGAKYVSVDKVGGKSVVWNQQVDTSNALLTTRAGVTLSRKENGKLFLSGTATGGDAWCIAGSANLVIGHKYISKRAAENVAVRIDNTETGRPAINFIGNIEVQTLTEPAGNIVYTPVREGEYVNSEIDPFIIDLTLMFGAGNEPTAEQFNRMFPAESYPYNAGEIISARTETITAGAESITTGFPELHSAGTAHDEIDMDGGEIRRNVGVVDLGTLNWTYSDHYGWLVTRDLNGIIAAPNYTGIYPNAMSNKLDIITQQNNTTAPGLSVWTNGMVSVKGDKLTSAADLSGVVLQYELATTTTEPVTIPEALQEWLPVEPGGTVTFRNADESKQLPVPNAVSWVRKLNEVE